MTSDKEKEKKRRTITQISVNKTHYDRDEKGGPWTVILYGKSNDRFPSIVVNDAEALGHVIKGLACGEGEPQ